MGKKPLIGVSILAVVLLVLGSLSNVIGYQSVKSSMSDSPLFQTRAHRAIKQGQNVITSHYLGMGKGCLFEFPVRDNRDESLQMFIDIISTMDDKTFEQFIKVCIQKIIQKNPLSDINPHEISQTFSQLRTKPEIHKATGDAPETNYFEFTCAVSVCNWRPGCIFMIILFSIGDRILRLLTVKNFCAYTSSIDC